MQPSRIVLLIPCLLFLWPVTTNVVAEQRFYQVMGADGRMQTILVPDEPVEKKPTPEKPVDDGRATAGAGEREAVGTQAVTPATNAHPEETPQSAAPLLSPIIPIPGEGSAFPVGEDEYIDSEELEREGFNSQKKKRFYLLNDGMGRFVEEVQAGELTDTGNQSVPTPALDEQDVVARWASDPVELTDAKALGTLRGGKPLCLPRSELANAARVQKGAVRAVRADAKVWQFMKEGDVLELFLVEGEGLHKLLLHSYSKKEKNPSFFMPVIAVADATGCITRAVTSGYFDRWVGATKTRQHSVQGSFILLSSDRYVMVLLPSRQQAVTSFPLSPFGEVAIHWHE